MRYPGYLLNPGDMFQVDTERVLFAMGRPKGVESEVPEDADEAGEPVPEEETSAPAPEDEELESLTPKEILKSLLAQSKSILANKREGISAKRKQDLRAFNKGLKKLMSKAGREDVDTSSVQSQLETIEDQLRIAREMKEQGKSAPPSAQPKAEGASSEASASATIKDVPEEVDEFPQSSARDIRLAMEAMSLNPVDESKPYATPWVPRDYLPAFAFIPRYLEVNQNICAAVYLRHPVARPGQSEVPSPYSEAANANAFAWYLRRR